jgi:hypothetical protein
MTKGTEGQWSVMRGSNLVGVIDVRDSDFPWLSGGWTPTAEFEEAAPLFRDELAVMNALHDEVDEWESAYAKIRQEVTLHYPDGSVVPEFLLHIDGDEAWFRWSDEMFPS